MEEPIATYEEARFELRRRFELFADRIRVVGKTLTGRFDESVPLAILHPHPNRAWVRGLLFRIGLWVVFILFCWIRPFIAISGTKSLTNGLLPIIFGAVALVGLLLLLVNARAAEFVRFRTDSGPITLDLGRVGPQVQEFDGFVDLLMQQIQKARAVASEGTVQREK